jgi:hypothetical protein
MKTPKHKQLLPTTAKVGIHEYDIVYDKDALISAGHRVDVKDTLCGLTEATGCNIYINDEMSFSQIQETVLHELLHAMFDLTGVFYELDDTVEERITRPLAPVLMQFLRDNPQLLRALGVVTEGGRR